MGVGLPHVPCLACWLAVTCVPPAEARHQSGDNLRHSALLQDATVVGSSMGASVLWSYIELYGHQHLGKLVFVDQTPLQVRLLWLCLGI